MRRIEICKDNWQIGNIAQMGEGNQLPLGIGWEAVTVPHVWNGDNSGEEGGKLYKHTFHIASDAMKLAHYIAFNGVAGVCKAWLNGIYLGEHRGGYARFSFSLAEALQVGENELLVLADNTRYDDVIPLGGDFTNYGGIYRPVELVSLSQNHFDMLYYGTNGLDIKTLANGTIYLNARTIAQENGRIKYTIFEGKNIVGTAESDVNSDGVTIEVPNPRRWKGKEDPFLYNCKAELQIDGVCQDEVELSFGFRDIHLCPEKGFFLNGEPFKMNGVAKHQDREGVACATSNQHLDEDMELIKEIGANAIRLSHYQHPQYFYDLCDQEGFVVWAEIPMLGMQDGNVKLQENACQQLTELILQLKHHPSICFWGVQNEIAMMGETLEMYTKTQELHDLVKKLDDTRISVGANLYCVKNNSQLNFITDMVGYNIYFGWYYGEMEEYNDFFDAFHRDNPNVPLGVSEYGVDCSTTLHSLSPKRKDYSEEFQCLYHETVYPMIQEREYLWGSFIWNMFDFGSAIRNEGGVKGKNCKGLVSYDRKICKDAFYYYKAQWSQTPFVHIAERRFVKRNQSHTKIKVYSNLEEITLIVEENSYTLKSKNGIFVFENIPLKEGETIIRAEAGNLSDEITLQKVEEQEASYIYNDPNPEVNVKNWFTLEESKEDLFPMDRFSIMDEMGTLLANPQVCELFEEMLPQLMDDPRSKSMPSITLLRVLNRISGIVGEEKMKEINKRLNKINK